jgi:uncharacterized protein YndB with AHSA1/START domain
MKIEKSYNLPFPRNQVFAAWISSETVISPATRMNVDPRVGGHYKLFMETPDFTAKCEGRFSKIVEDEFLQYSWEWNGDGETSEIAVKFSDHENGTHIELIHEKFTKQESVAMHDAGWDSYVGGLRELLENASS